MKLLYTFLSLSLSLFMLHAQAQRKGYWQQHVDYTMHIDVNEKLYQYAGDMKLLYTNNSGKPLNKVYFHLYFNAFQPGSMMDYRLQTISDPDKRMMAKSGNSDALQSRIALLQPNEIGYQKIKSLTFNGAPTKYAVNGTILTVELPEALEDGAVGEFKMTWDAQVPEQIRRSGRNSKEGVALSMTQWYPKMAQFDDYGWHLDEYVAREFIAPFGNFDVTIHLNKDFVVGGSGKLQNPTQVKGYDLAAKPKADNNNKVAWHFKANQIHDFAWAADPKMVVDSAQTKDGVTVYTVFLPTDKEVIQNWKTALGLATEFFDFASAKFGAYPWPTYSIVQGGDGGMEYGTATLVTGGRKLEGLVGVIFHEAAHSWYQHLFGINETVDEWFDEGFTSYVQDIAFQELFDKKGAVRTNPMIGSYRAYYKLVLSGKEEPMSLLADYYKTNYGYTQSSYTKGSVLAEQLGYIIGKENLAKTFLAFYDQWKFKHPTPNDFKRVAEEVSGINLKWYFNLFINTTRTIDYGIDQVTDQHIVLRNKSDLAMPLDVLVEYQDGSQELLYIPLREMRGQKPAEGYAVYNDVKRTVLEDWFWTKPTYSIPLSKKPRKVTIDPTQRLADVESSDNTISR